MKTRLVVRGVIVQDGMALVNHTESGFHLLGGGVKRNEALHEALIRELDEEVGAMVHVGPMLAINETRKRGKRTIEMVFSCDPLKPLTNVESKEKGITPRWIPADSLSVLFLGDRGTRPLFLAYGSAPEFHDVVRRRIA